LSKLKERLDDGLLIIVNIILILMLFVGIMCTLVGLPGNWLIMIAAVGYGFFDNFVHLDVRFLLVLLAVFLAGEVIEFIAGMLGAKRGRASNWATLAACLGAVAGGIAGTGVFPVVGSLIGALAGGFGASYLVEYLVTGQSQQARRVARKVVLGQLAGMLAKLAVATGMAVGIISRLPW